jgi:N-acetylglucosaminyldiphosphoundecaprenol N-acetyl-beta-D-mannosaminyltransferase
LIKVLNIPLFDQGLEIAVSDVVSVCISDQPKENRCISATGAHGLVYAHKNPEFANTLHNFHINLPDGMPGVWVGRLKGASEMKRCYGPEFFRELIIATKDLQIRHYFCGGKSGVAEELKEVCLKKYGNPNVVGTFCPPFRELSESECRNLANDINEKKTDILWIGISTPKQEKLARRLSQYTNVHFLATVGAAFDFHLGKVQQAPRFIQQLGLEWFFRLCIEPRRLYKRYLEIVPCFIYYNLKEFLTTSPMEDRSHDK